MQYDDVTSYSACPVRESVVFPFPSQTVAFLLEVKCGLMYKDQGVGTVVTNVVRPLHYWVRRWGRLKSKKKIYCIYCSLQGCDKTKKLQSEDELAVNIYRRESVASLALKFQKAGCQNIHLDILKADFVKRNKCASLGTYSRLPITRTFKGN